MLATLAAGCGLSWEPIGEGQDDLGGGGSGNGSGNGNGNGNGSGDGSGDGSGSGSGSGSSTSTGGANVDCSVETECDACIACADTGPCAAEYDACLQDPGCAALRACGAACTTIECVHACIEQNPEAAEQYLALADCVVCDACAQSCAVLGEILACAGP